MTEPITTAPSFHFIDRSEALNAIRRTYGDRYHLIPEALWEAAALVSRQQPTALMIAVSFMR